MKKESIDLQKYIDAGMDEIFIKMFGEKYAHAFWKELMPSVNMYFMDEPEKYSDDESKKECISEMLLNGMEYLRNKDSVWYE